MSGDIKTCIVILCCVLSVVNVSGLNSDRQAIKNFINKYNRQKQILFYNLKEARWTLLTNNSEYNRQITALEIGKLNKFTRSMSCHASRFNLSRISKSDRRQLRKIMDIGRDAQTNVTKRRRLNQVINAIAAIYENELFPEGSGLYEMLRKSKSHDLMEARWLRMMDVWGRDMKDLFTEYVNLSNEAARILGYPDAGAYRRSLYDSPTFEDDVRDLYNQLSPFYEQLHAYIRRKLITEYGRDKFPSSGHIPAHLFENILWYKFQQSLRPFPEKETVDVTDEMVRQNYTVKRILETADNFFKSMGMKAVPPEFWNKSLFEIIIDGQPQYCYPEHWDFHNGRDYRIKMCARVDESSLYLAHRVLGYIQYSMQYANQPEIFRQEANPEFDMQVSQAIFLSVQTEEHLYNIGLLDTVNNDNESDINYLMSMALQLIHTIPYSYVNEEWRWKVFRGDITPDKYNEEWWNLMCLYDGVSEPVQGSSAILYPSSSYDITGDTSGSRHFVGEVIKHQLHKALCNISGHRGPLHRCDIYNSRKAGKKLRDVLKLGSSKPWPEVLQLLTGQSKMDAAPVLEYYQPLLDYLKKVNKNDYGWKPVCPTPKPKLCKKAIPDDCTCEKKSECECHGCCKRGICKWK